MNKGACRKKPRAGRQRLLAWILPCLAALLMVSCEAGGRKTVTIRFWNGFTGPDGRTMLRMIKRFNKENPDVQVLMQRLDWATYYNKLFVAGLGGRAPDVFVVHASNMERFKRGNFLRTVDDFVTTGSPILDSSDFSPNVWQSVEKRSQVHADGVAHMGVPLDVHMLGMYYNRKLLKDAGIVDPQGNPAVPLDGARFLEALKKTTKPDGSQWGMVFTWLRTNLYTIMCQYGGKFFNEDATKCLLDSPENIAALQWCVDAIMKHKVAPLPLYFDAWVGFRQGRVAMAPEGIYMLPDLQKQTDLDFGASVVPVIGKEPATWADSHVMCMRKDLDDDKTSAAIRLMKFLSDNSLDWAEGGQVPVRKSLLASERFKAMPIQYEFSKQLPYIRYMPRIPFIFEFLTEFDVAIEKALRGSMDPQKALTEAARQIDTIIQRRITSGEDAPEAVQ